MVNVTAAAAAEIGKRLEGQPESLGLRIYVKGYG